MLKLTRLTFASLEFHGLVPISGQRVVVDDVLNLATAIDLVCLRDNTLVLVELKSGYAGDRGASAVINGKVATMHAPLKRANDSNLHRHLSQLTATVALFDAETDTLVRLRQAGVQHVEGVLLYVDDAGSELHTLPDWWRRRGDAVLSRLCGDS